VYSGSNRSASGVGSAKVKYQAVSFGLDLLTLDRAIVTDPVRGRSLGKYTMPVNFYADDALQPPAAYEVDRFASQSLAAAPITMSFVPGGSQSCLGSGPSLVCTQSVQSSVANPGSPVLTSRQGDPALNDASLEGVAISSSVFVLLHSAAVASWISAYIDGVWGYTDPNLTGIRWFLGACNRSSTTQVDLRTAGINDQLSSLSVVGDCQVDGYNDLNGAVSNTWWFTDTDLRGSGTNDALTIVSIKPMPVKAGIYFYSDPGFSGHSEAELPANYIGGGEDYAVSNAVRKSVSSFRVYGRTIWDIVDDPNWAPLRLLNIYTANYEHRVNTSVPDLTKPSPFNNGITGWNDVITGFILRT
jgi:hypothetical protein